MITMGQSIHSMGSGLERNKQLPPCPSRVKFVGGNLTLLQGCPQDNLKLSNKFLSHFDLIILNGA